MNRCLLLVGLLALAACDSDVPTMPDAAPVSDADWLAKWTRTELPLNHGMVMVREDGGYIFCKSKSPEGRLATVKERTKSTGELQMRLQGQIGWAEIEIRDASGSWPPLEEFSGPAHGSYKFFENDARPESWSYGVQLVAQIDGVTLDCRFTYEQTQSGADFVGRVVFGERCWESPPGNLTLPCPAT